MPKPPSTREELDNDRLATEGYAVPAGTVGPPATRWPTASGLDGPGVGAPAPLPEAVRNTAHEPDFVVPGAHEAQPVPCLNCGATWWFSAHLLVTGPRKIERVPGTAGILICANCGAIHQEARPNVVERIRFVDGRLTQ